MRYLKFIPIFIAMTVFVACDSTDKQSDSEENQVVDLDMINQENLLKEIKKREAVYNEKGSGTNNRRGIELMRAYAAYGNRFGNTQAAPEYLFKAGEMAMGLELPSEALKYLDKLFQEYPSYEKRPFALFLQAFVLENQTQNQKEAIRIYEQFIEEFPSHEMADDAAYSIENMGKSPEELIRQFEKQDSIKKAKESV